MIGPDILHAVGVTMSVLGLLGMLLIWRAQLMAEQVTIAPPGGERLSLVLADILVVNIVVGGLGVFILTLSRIIEIVAG